jgi:hypothetical protein
MEEQRESKAIKENLFWKIYITKSMAYFWIEFGLMDALRRKGRLPEVPSVAVAKNQRDY